ncbi:hypothetical protein OUZ56_028572 [Daphnia magna]|uniref:Uncharacterized protein n=1 Tax=Daphnia magna TaxID=35525 RepID=A0ABR0B493_9CRUS|nr:hypothetical protein OUZ56_028572 [Daphnia magna]
METDRQTDVKFVSLSEPISTSSFRTSPSPKNERVCDVHIAKVAPLNLSRPFKVCALASYRKRLAESGNVVQTKSLDVSIQQANRTRHYR